MKRLPVWITLLSVAALAVGCSEAPGLPAIRAASGLGVAVPAPGGTLIHVPFAEPAIPADAPRAAEVVAVRETRQASLPDRAAVTVRAFHEPNDYAHRNYCGAGATQVLLSAWIQPVADIEAIARRNALDPRIGQTGAATVSGINGWLDSMVVPVIGRSWYRGSRITSQPELVDILRQDLGSPLAKDVFGHGAPVMVQLMTPTLPGWNRWNATHMLTIYAYDLSAHDPAKDTVSYMETPAPMAGYRGPATQTISVKMLWEAMVAFYTREKDPINVIW